MGATILPGLTDNIDLPRLKASGTAGWGAEHTDATGSDPQFDKVSMSPKTVTALYEVSRRMLLQAANLDPILRGDLGYHLAQGLDGAAIAGGGANQPAGILANANVNVLSLGANGAAMTVDTAADLMGLVDDANAFGNLGFLTNSKVKKAAGKLKDLQSRPYGLAEVFKQSLLTFRNQVPWNLIKGTSGAVCSARRTLLENKDILALFDHDTRAVLGRTSAGTVRLNEDAKGLHFEIDMPATTLGRDLMVSVERGDIRGASFSFKAREDRWTQGNDGKMLRELLDVDLFEITVTAVPAYADTEVARRSMQTKALPPRLSMVQRYLDILEVSP